ncbi:hypothetical protein [Streptomyces sp. NPDC045714]|uniref:hypothetical protein n=1 Tax=Streptomyces sp. NPDC045714 TaxID=3154913 RepID=UPI0033E2B0E7
MRPMTREEVRGAIVNLDPAAKKVRLPARFDDVRWHRIDYLGLRSRTTAFVRSVAEPRQAPIGRTPPRPRSGPRA